MGIDLRRCRPLLGTLVEITIRSHKSSGVDAIVDAAFDEIAQVHRLMSFHDDDSDVTRFNRSEFGTDVQLDPRTYDVLRLASELHFFSAGAFDINVASHLRRHGLLPGLPSDSSVGQSSTGDGVSLLPDYFARKTRSNVSIDVGGIAKGYAVDRAIALLRDQGVGSALVNAGGDLAVLGGQAWPITVRDPRAPDRVLCEIALASSAVASSGGLFDPISGVLQGRHSIVDPSTGMPSADLAGATVYASSCMLADALTKVVMLKGEDSHAILTRYDASALAVSTSGHVLCTPDWPRGAEHAA